MPRFKYEHKKYDDDGLECPVCGSKFVSTSYYEMARHIATTGNKQPLEKHRQWRMKHRIQADHNYPHEVEEMITKIFNHFKWG